MQKLLLCTEAQRENGFKGSRDVAIFWAERNPRIEFAEYVYLCAKFLFPIFYLDEHLKKHTWENLTLHGETSGSPQDLGPYCTRSHVVYRVKGPLSVYEPCGVSILKQNF